MIWGLCFLPCSPRAPQECAGTGRSPGSPQPCTATINYPGNDFVPQPALVWELLCAPLQLHPRVLHGNFYFGYPNTDFLTHCCFAAGASICLADTALFNCSKIPFTAFGKASPVPQEADNTQQKVAGVRRMMTIP